MIAKNDTIEALLFIVRRELVDVQEAHSKIARKLDTIEALLSTLATVDEPPSDPAATPVKPKEDA